LTKERGQRKKKMRRPPARRKGVSKKSKPGFKGKHLRVLKKRN